MSDNTGVFDYNYDSGFGFIVKLDSGSAKKLHSMNESSLVKLAVWRHCCLFTSDFVLFTANRPFDLPSDLRLVLL